MHQSPKVGTDPDRPVHIVFVGAGAVGCFYASRLHFPSHNIHTSLIARSNYKVLASEGVKLKTHSFGDYTFIPDAVYPSVAAAATAPSRDPAAPGARQWDYVIVTTKALPDRTDDSELIAPLVGPNTCIVLIQNGVGVEHPYRVRFPNNPILSAVTVVSAEQISLGTIRQNRWTRIHLGPYSNSASFASTTTPPIPHAANISGGPDGLATAANVAGPFSSKTTSFTSTRPPTATHPHAADISGGPDGLASEGQARSTPSPSNTKTTPHHHVADISGGPDGLPTKPSTTDADLQTRGMALAHQLGDYWTRLGGIRDVELSDEIDLQLVRWHKLCINAAFNPSAVLSGGRGNADMVHDPELRIHLASVMQEIWDAVPAILGRGFPKDDKKLATPDRILKSTERNVGSKPSMLLDWEAGRPMEIEVILGNPVRIARARGVELKRMQALYALLRSMQQVREEREKKAKEAAVKGKL